MLESSAALGEPKVLERPEGPVRYFERGRGQTIVFVHEWPTSAETWRRVVPLLSDRFRCVTPEWPHGFHTLPLWPGADLSLPGIARLMAGVLAHLDDRAVTLVGSGGGGTLSQIVAAEYPERVGRLAVSTGDALWAFPAPALYPFQALGFFAPAAYLFIQAARVPALARALLRLGAKRPPDDWIIRGYVQRAAASAGVRRDMRKSLRGLRGNYGRTVLGDLARFAGPALVVWAREDLVFPVEHGRRLAELLPRSRFMEIDDCRTLIGEDQPEWFAARIAELMDEPERLGLTPSHRGGAP